MGSMAKKPISENPDERPIPGPKGPRTPYPVNEPPDPRGPGSEPDYIPPPEPPEQM